MDKRGGRHVGNGGRGRGEREEVWNEYRRMYKRTLISWHCVKFLALSAFSVRWSVFDRKTTSSSRRSQGVLPTAFMVATRNAPLDVLERKNTSSLFSLPLYMYISLFLFLLVFFLVRVRFFLFSHRPSPFSLLCPRVWTRYIKMIYSPY